MGPLALYIGLQVLIVGLVAGGIDDLRLRLTWPLIFIWLALVVGVAAGRRLAWVLLTAYAFVTFLTSAVILAGRASNIGAMLLLSLIALQTAVLFSPGFRSL